MQMGPRCAPGGTNDRKEGETEPNRPNRTEPNRLIPEPAGTGWNRPEPDVEPTNRTGPSHGVSEKRKPNRVEPGKIDFRTEPNRTDEFSKSLEPKRIEPDRFLPGISIIIVIIQAGLQPPKGGLRSKRNVMESMKAETFTQARRQAQAAGSAWVWGPEDRTSQIGKTQCTQSGLVPFDTF